MLGRRQRHVKGQRRLSHRRTPGEHEQFAAIKSAQIMIELVDAGSDLQLLACTAPLLLVINLRQHPVAHFGRRAGSAMHGKFIFQLLQVLTRSIEPCHHVDTRFTRFDHTRSHPGNGLSQHPATDHPGGIRLDETGIAHLQHAIGNKSQPVQLRGMLRVDPSHLPFHTQHIDIRLMLVKRQHRPVNQAISRIGKHLRTQTVAHFANGSALRQDGQYDGLFHLFGRRHPIVCTHVIAGSDTDCLWLSGVFRLFVFHDSLSLNLL